MSIRRRLSAVALTLALMMGNAVLCAGWMPNPEARMACCAEGGLCPMHTPDFPDSGSSRAIGQAEADSCCAASERAGTATSAPVFVVAAPLAVVPSPLPLVLPEAMTAPDSWRTLVPIPGTQVPKHLLLSVFLV